MLRALRAALAYRPKCTNRLTDRLLYVLVGAGQRGVPFDVDNRTGEIVLTERLDYERQQSYQLTVVAGDLGVVGSLPAYARVSLRVLDVNDNRPDVVVNPLTESGRIEVVEHSDQGAFAAYVAVRDADSGKNGASQCLVHTNADRPGDWNGLKALNGVYNSSS